MAPELPPQPLAGLAPLPLGPVVSLPPTVGPLFTTRTDLQAVQQDLQTMVEELRAEIHGLVGAAQGGVRQRQQQQIRDPSGTVTQQRQHGATLEQHATREQTQALTPAQEVLGAQPVLPVQLHAAPRGIYQAISEESQIKIFHDQQHSTLTGTKFQHLPVKQLDTVPRP